MEFYVSALFCEPAADVLLLFRILMRLVKLFSKQNHRIQMRGQMLKSPLISYQSMKIRLRNPL